MFFCVFCWPGEFVTRVIIMFASFVYCVCLFVDLCCVVLVLSLFVDLLVFVGLAVFADFVCLC